VELTRSGAGVATLWESFVSARVERGDLVQFGSLVPHAPRLMSMDYVSRHYLPSRLSRFLDPMKRRMDRAD
jgi:DNA-binding transcriptional LysR family regulator